MPNSKAQRRRTPGEPKKVVGGSVAWHVPVLLERINRKIKGNNSTTIQSAIELLAEHHGFSIDSARKEAQRRGK